MVLNKYEFSERAAKELEEIINYITYELCNKKAANKLYKDIKTKIGFITTFPEAYKIIDNFYLRKKLIRKAIVSNYYIFYEYYEYNHLVIIVSILYNKRDINNYLKGIQNEI